MTPAPAANHREGDDGFAHLVLIVLIAVIGVLLLTAWLDGSAPSTTTEVGQTETPRTGRAHVDVESVVAQVDPTTVDITTVLSGGRGQAAATGIILTPTGEVLTNNHVIAGATQINAQVDGTGRRYTARVLGYDVGDDVALLQLDGASGLRAAVTAPSTTARVGDGVVAIGNAHGLGSAPIPEAGTITAFGQRVTAGDAGAPSETLSDMIEISSPVQPGDSGGPLVDAQARVIGMTTAAADEPAGQSTGVGDGFAIPIERAEAIVAEIRAGRGSDTVHIGPRAVLGVAIKTVRSAPAVADVHGAVVGLVDNTGPAGAVGLRADDVIVAVDGTAIGSLADLEKTLDHYRPGDEINLAWTESATGQSRTASLRLIAGPPL